LGHEYLVSISITEENEARVLGSPSAWEILDELRGAGLKGRTAEEISKELGIPISTVYGVLNRLDAIGYLETRRLAKRLGRPSKDVEENEKRTGKKKRIYVEHVQWGGISLDDDFADFFDKTLQKLVDKSKIAEFYSELVDKMITTMENNSDGRDLLPSMERCPVCKSNHEATEYVWALVLAICAKIFRSDELVNICKKHNYELIS
jgi:DNA-binding MarR family transcriptional regulator